MSRRVRKNSVRVAVSLWLAVVLSLLPVATLYASASGNIAFCGEITSDVRQQMFELWRGTPLERELPHPAGPQGGDMSSGHCSVCTLSQSMVPVAVTIAAPEQVAIADSPPLYDGVVNVARTCALASPRAPPHVLG